MSEGFKRQLEGAIKNAGSETPNEETSRDVEKMRSIAGTEAWSDIEHTQEEKRALVHEFREWRKKFWNADGEHAKERADSFQRIAKFENGDAARTLRMNADGAFEGVMKGGEAITLTRGEVYAAAEWGTWWKFDDSISREHQLALMGSQVRARIAERYDDQLITFGKNDRLSDDRKRDAYARMESSQQSLDTMPDGILAEKMLVSFLTKEMHDGDLEFTVSRADAHDDIEHKIDFIITVADRRRGVRVHEPEHRIGIQFTMDRGATERKQEQVARAGKRLRETDVDELILITMPFDDVRTNYDRWRYDEQGKHKNEKRLDPRGPDQYWSAETKKAILDALVRQLHHA